MNITRLGLAPAALAIALLLTEVVPAMAAQSTLVVDDDRQQCPAAGYDSINAALAAATPGDIIRVCPGLYNETVVVEKSDVWLQGSTNGSATEPCLRGEDAANAFADSVINGAVRLAANGVRLDGFTVQGAPVDPNVLAAAGIATSAAASGYVIRRNVVQDNPDGIDLNSNGATPTLVQHNCIRRNNVGGEGGVGIFAEQGLLRNARIEANTLTGHEFSSMFLGYGLVAFPVITAPNRDLIVSQNVSVDDGIGGIIVSNVAHVEISHNRIVRTGNAVAVYTPASDVLVAYNEVENSLFIGIRIDGNPFGCCSFPTGPARITVAHNRVSGAGTLAPQDGIVLNRTSNSIVLDNLVERSSRDGISVRDSTENVIARNHADLNARDGIRSRGTSSGNTFEANHMSGNAEHDAHDDNRAANSWTANHCTTDLPAGMICDR